MWFSLERQTYFKEKTTTCTMMHSCYGLAICIGGANLSFLALPEKFDFVCFLWTFTLRFITSTSSLHRRGSDNGEIKSHTLVSPRCSTFLTQKREKAFPVVMLFPQHWAQRTYEPNSTSFLQSGRIGSLFNKIRKPSLPNWLLGLSDLFFNEMTR